MKTKVLITAFFCVLLAGCSLRRKPAKSAVPPAAPKPAATPAPVLTPAPPLSIPQTHVELPKPQPLDPAALATQTTENAPPEPPPTPVPARRRASPAASQPASPPPAATPAPEPRETVREIVSPAESKRLQDAAQARRREVNQILNGLGRRMTSAQQKVAETIRSFLALSEEAEKQNDMRQADALAERAQILAKELQSGQ